MQPDLLYTLIVLGAAMLLFMSASLRMDVVALLALLALALPGIVSPAEALSGFADPVVIMFAGLFVVGGAFFRTGLADTVGQWLARAAKGSYPRILVLVMLSTAGMSAFLSSTGTVALMLPIVVTVARRARLSPSLLLLPTAFAALLGGMLTLIATPPNLIVSGELQASGLAPLGFFDFTGPGLVMLTIGVLYMLLVGRRLLPERVPASDDPAPPGTRELWERYGLQDRLVEVEVMDGSPLADMTIKAAAVRSRFGTRIVAISSVTARGRAARRAEAGAVLRVGDRLTVKASQAAAADLVRHGGVRLLGEQVALPEGLLLAEALVPPGSRLVGETVATIGLRDRFGVEAMGILRAGGRAEPLVTEVKLQGGDAMLLLGSVAAFSAIRQERGDLVLVTEAREVGEARLNRSRAPVALLIMLAMLVMMAFTPVPNVLAVLLAALACVMTGCLDADEAYRSIDWRTLVLMAGLMPVATALASTGGIDLLVAGLLAHLAGFGPLLVMAAFFVLTSAIGLVVSNTATAVLIAPVAVHVAVTLGMDPRAMAMTVAIAASSAFVTPVSSPVNLLILGAGGYRFGDFVKVGLPLLLLMLAATLLVVPLFFPPVF